MLRPLEVSGRPHWESTQPPEVWPIYEEFRNFLIIVWDHLGLPSPTEEQLEAAHRLQYGADSYEWATLDRAAQDSLYWSPREDILRCFRAFGKSYITSAYVIWRIMRNPRDEKALVISAATGKATEFVAQTRGIIESLPLCQWLLVGGRENDAPRRDQAFQFDVAGSSLSQSYSVAARGITGQITGSRATLLIPDDIEIERNSATEDARQRILRIVTSDFINIVKTEHGRGDIIFLGTPQTEESVYNALVKEMGFRCWTVPVQMPTGDKQKNYTLISTQTGQEIVILAPYLVAKAAEGKLKAGQTTSCRFTLDELSKAQSKGASSFALQMMLDTSLSDAERYPLKQHDLIVFSLNPLKAPLMCQWGRHNDKRNYITGIPNLGFSGDHFLRPLFVDEKWVDYEGSVLFVDPAGRGKDETAWAVLKSLNGVLYLLHVDGFAGDPAEAMHRIALDAKKYNVNVVEVEPNYGQGMWVTAFKPILLQVWTEGCQVRESEWAVGRKEVRIIDTLEPVMTMHRLVVDETLVTREAKATDHKFSWLYQLTHITRDANSLKHDDRLDAVAGAVAFFMRAMGMNVTDAAQAVRNAAMEKEIEDFEENYAIGLTLRRGGPRRLRGPLKGGKRDEVTTTTVRSP